jgi:hypothetical protein
MLNEDFTNPTTNHNETLTIKFGGKMDGIDAREFINAFNDYLWLVEDAFEQHSEQTLELKIQKAGKGSFWLEVSAVVVQTLAQTNLTETFQVASEVVKFVKDCGSLFKFLGGEKPKSVSKPDKNGQVVVQNLNAENCTVNINVFNHCHDNPAVQEHVKSMVEATKKSGAEDLTIYQQTETEPKVICTYSKEDIDELAKIPSQPTPPVVYTITETENKRRVQLKILSVVFNPKRKWDVYYQQQKISVRMDDVHFLKKVHEREELFGYGDEIIADLQYEVAHDRKNDIKEINKKSYIITRIHHHQTGEKESQLSLF